jgi:hypothetical protein
MTKEELTRLLRAQPFVPFTVKLRNGDHLFIGGVEMMSTGRNVFSFVDEQGFIGWVPYDRIDSILGQQTPDIP